MAAEERSLATVPFPLEAIPGSPYSRHLISTDALRLASCKVTAHPALFVMGGANELTLHTQSIREYSLVCDFRIVMYIFHDNNLYIFREIKEHEG